MTKQYLVEVPRVAGWKQWDYLNVIAHAFGGWPATGRVRVKSAARVAAGAVNQAKRRGRTAPWVKPRAKRAA
jgi:hypothetical protein